MSISPLFLLKEFYFYIWKFPNTKSNLSLSPSFPNRADLSEAKISSAKIFFIFLESKILSKKIFLLNLPRKKILKNFFILTSSFFTSRINWILNLMWLFFVWNLKLLLLKVSSSWNNFHLFEDEIETQRIGPKEKLQRIYKFA